MSVSGSGSKEKKEAKSAEPLSQVSPILASSLGLNRINTRSGPLPQKSFFGFRGGGGGGDTAPRSAPAICPGPATPMPDPVRGVGGRRRRWRGRVVGCWGSKSIGWIMGAIRIVCPLGARSLRTRAPM
jgi:hypothetical protein